MGHLSMESESVRRLLQFTSKPTLDVSVLTLDQRTNVV